MPKTIVSSQKGPQPEFIKNLFDSISGNYDLTNSFMTFGLHKSWKNKLVNLSQATPQSRVLDCATGTGDIALEFKKQLGSKSFVLGTDFCEGMLAQAPIKAKELNLDVLFERADAMNLPYDSASFDVVSMAYGIRNVQDPKKCLSEMIRVLKPGGRLMILETGNNQNPLIKPFIHFYFKYIVPIIGTITSGKPSAYQYLNQSSLNFPCGNEFVDLMQDLDEFSNIQFYTLLGGASYIYRGIKKGYE